MIPGPYAICHVTFPDPASDAAHYQALRFGYDTADQAYRELVSVAEASGVASKDCVVIRHIDREEAVHFLS